MFLLCFWLIFQAIFFYRLVVRVVHRYALCPPLEESSLRIAPKGEGLAHRPQLEEVEYHSQADRQTALVAVMVHAAGMVSGGGV